MAALNRYRTRHRRAAQNGYVLLLTLISLLVLLFGVLFTMRGTLLQSVMTGNTLQRQKDVQASDLALRQVEQAIVTTVQGAGDVPLDVAAASKKWFYTPPGPGAWAAPGDPTGVTAGFWATCLGNGNCDTLANVVGTVAAPLSGDPILVTVVPTNQPPNQFACGTTGFTASYYDIFLHTAEANGTTAANTETVFKLCTP